MRDRVIENLTARFAAYDDLIASVDDEVLKQKIDVPRHKSLLEHLWCIIGSRESYARAIAQGEWQGWDCSMSGYKRADFAKKLGTSAKAVLDAIEGVTDWTPERERQLASLAEHEVMHEGQIIRHIYALELKMPASCVWA